MVKILKKNIAFGLPKRIETILLTVFVFALFLWDINQNKVIDFGTSYMVTVFGNFMVPARTLGLIALIIFHLALISLFVYSLKRKNTSNFWDVGIGTLALFGVAILLAGYQNEVHKVTTFFFVEMKSVTFYHIGIALEALAAFFWAFTD